MCCRQSAYASSADLASKRPHKKTCEVVLCKAYLLVAVLLLADVLRFTFAFRVATEFATTSIASFGYRQRRGEQSQRSWNYHLVPSMLVLDANEDRVLFRDKIDGQIGSGVKSRVGEEAARTKKRSTAGTDPRKRRPTSKRCANRNFRTRGATPVAGKRGRLGSPKVNFGTMNPSLVHQSVTFYLQRPGMLDQYGFVGLGLAAVRHCDIHLLGNVCRAAQSVGISVDNQFMTKFAKACCQAGRWAMLPQILELMRSLGVSPNEIAYTCILSGLAKHKQYDQAMAMTQSEGLTKSLFAYNAIISACPRDLKIERAMGYLKDMREAGVTPNKLTYSSVISCIGDGSEGSTDRALEVLTIMKEEGLQPDTTCMNVMMAISVRGRQLNQALDIFRQMEEDDVARDVISFNTAISACDKLRDAATAVRLLREAGKAELTPDVFTYNSVISALGHNSMWQEALQMYHEMTALNIVPNIVTYNTLMAAGVRARCDAEALLLLDVMRANGVQPNEYSYTSALHACQHLNDGAKAMSFLDDIEAIGRTCSAHCYATAMRACYRSNMAEVVFPIYARLQQRGILPNQAVFKALLEVLVQLNDGDRVWWVLDQMIKTRVLRDAGHLQLALNACTTQAETALRVVRMSRQSRHTPSARLFSQALEVCVTAGNNEVANEVIKEMAGVGLELTGGLETQIQTVSRALSRPRTDYEEDQSLDIEGR